MSTLKPARGVAPINLSRTTHQLITMPTETGMAPLLGCVTCGADFRQEGHGNFAWPITPGVSAVCQPLPQEYRALSTKQPWAGMIARGEKDLEIRTQRLSYRGDLLICAGQQADHLRWLHPAWPAHQAAKDPLGVAICLVEMYDCKPMRKADEQRAQCPYELGLWAYYLRNPRPVKPVAVKGALGLMRVSVALELA